METDHGPGTFEEFVSLNAWNLEFELLADVASHVASWICCRDRSKFLYTIWFCFFWNVPRYWECGIYHWMIFVQSDIEQTWQRNVVCKEICNLATQPLTPPQTLNHWEIPWIWSCPLILGCLPETSTRWWCQGFFIFIPTWGNEWSNLTNIFQMGWHHQPENHGEYRGLNKFKTKNVPLGGSINLGLH